MKGFWNGNSHTTHKDSLKPSYHSNPYIQGEPLLKGEQIKYPNLALKFRFIFNPTPSNLERRKPTFKHVTLSIKLTFDFLPLLAVQSHNAFLG